MQSRNVHRRHLESHEALHKLHEEYKIATMQIAE